MIQEVIFASRAKAESLQGLENWAVISITDPGKSVADLQPGWGHLYRVDFHDLDPSLATEKKLRTRFLMSKDQAREIANFVKSVADSVDGILVHCEGGMSRSSAVAKWIAVQYQLDFNHTYELHNKYVYRQMIESKRGR